jgi:hypothetical protein
MMASMNDDPASTPPTCIETISFPAALRDPVSSDSTHEHQRPILKAIGQRYQQVRAELMAANNEDLTSTYNRFHDRSETSDGILGLRKPASAAGSGGAPGLRLG